MPPHSRVPYDCPEAMDPPEGTSWAALLAHVPPGARVLDVGCSTGSFAVAMKRKGCRVTGVEVNAEAAAVARTRCDEVLVGDIATLLEGGELAPGAFDVVVAADVLEHLVDPAPVVRASARLLAPGGVLLASLPNVTHASVILEMCRGRFPYLPEGLLDATHLHFFGEESALALFTDAGYAAEVVGRVRRDPRHTEFASDLFSVPDAVLAFLDRNPSADTYQFIIRAVLGGTAGVVPHPPRAERPVEPLRNRLVSEANELRDALRDHHDAAVAREREMAAQNERLKAYHEALVGKDAAIAEAHDLLRERHEAALADQREIARLCAEGRELGEALAGIRDDLADTRERLRQREARTRRLLHALVPLAAVRVLYVADGHDAPARYRCAHAVAQLRLDDVIANVMRIDDPALLDAVPSYSIVVLFRLPWSPHVEALVERTRSQGATLLFDIDDLVFDVGAERLLPFFDDFEPGLQQQYLDLFPRLRRTFDACDYFVGSTPALARAAEALGKEAFVHPNLVSDAYVRQSRLLRAVRSWRGVPPTIAYLSGSNTHDRDFSSIAAALARLLIEDPARRLLVCGFMNLPDHLAPFATRITHLPYQDWRVYPWVLARCRVTVAPMAVVNEFTNAKSALKFFEAGVFGLPTVATPAESFRDAIIDGENGFLATDEAEWVEKIRLALDPARAHALGERARTTVLARFSFAANRGRLRDLLHSLVGHAPGPRPALGRAEVEAGASGVRHLLERWDRARRQWAVFHGRAPEGAAPRPAPLPPSGPRRLEPLPEARFEAVLATLAAEGSTGLRRDGPVVYRAADGPAALAAWRADGDLRGGADGAYDSVGADPHLLGPAMWLRTADFRYLAVRMAVEPSRTPALAQLFWLREAAGGFAEEASVIWPVDAERRLYVLDLGDSAWKRHRVARRLRLDPLDCPGRVTIEGMWLLGDLAPLDAGTDARGGEEIAPGAHRGPGVDIVVPVYNSREETIACLESVLRHARGDWRLVVVDDASTDGELAAYLDRFGAHPRVRLLRNERNLGFVGTANRGMREAAGRDVLLLNSDTVVAAGFLEGLRACAYAGEGTGIACPLSNNATICSVPEFCQPNAVPDGHTVESFADLIAATSLRSRPELVTAVGFCMYVRASVLAGVAPFDETSFPRGYGEENDFCERAREAGFTVRLADDVFVYHAGEASFGAETGSLKRANYDTLERLHPGFFARVAHFIRQNPLADIHENVRLALRRGAPRDPALLVLLHASFEEPAGGTEHHVRDLVEATRLRRVVVAAPDGDGLRLTEVVDGAVDDPLRYRLRLARTPRRFMHEGPEVAEALHRIVRLFGIGAVHVHHLLNWPIDVWRTFVALDLPFVYTAHDYYCVCPSLNLIDTVTGQPCCAATNAAARDAAACLEHLFESLTLPLPADPPEFLSRHREEFRLLLGAAHTVVFPSAAARDIVGRFHPLSPARVAVIPHGYDAPPRPAHAAGEHDLLRVAVLGQVAHLHKGAREYLALIDRTRHLPLEWHVFGDPSFGYDRELEALGLGSRLVVHGGYRREDICARLAATGIDVAVLLPIWPETFSYTLSEALAAGVPAIVGAEGAPPERIAGTGAGIVVHGVEEAGAALDRLTADRAALRELQAAAAGRHPSVADMAERYRELYDALLATAAHPAPLDETERGELFAAHQAALPAVPAPAPVVPLPHYGRWWYPLYARLAPAVPGSLRRWGRDLMAKRQWRPVRTWRFGDANGNVVGSEGLELVRAGRQGATYRILNKDPALILRPDPFSTRDVRLIRFEMRCRAKGFVFAQLYWTHSDDEHFSEEKSIQVPVEGGEGRWQEYAVHVDESDRRDRWDEGTEIRRLRFDPLNVPSTVELRALSFCVRAR